MEKNNDNIRSLMEMLDNPAAFSEQEIRDIICRDDETRETYSLMVDAKRSIRRQNSQQADVDEAWKRFIEGGRRRMEREELEGENPSTGVHTHSLLFKIAATFVGILIVSGIAFAAINIARNATRSPESATTEVQIANTLHAKAPIDTLQMGSSAMQTITFDNVTLNDMLAEIAAFYHSEVSWQNGDARQLRFYFVWYREQSLTKVVETLNHFEHVNITIEDNKIIVE